MNRRRAGRTGSTSWRSAQGGRRPFVYWQPPTGVLTEEMDQMYVVFEQPLAETIRGRAPALLLVLVVSLLVAGCSAIGLSSDKVDYRAVQPQRPLDRRGAGLV